MSQGANNYNVCGTLVPNSISNALDLFGGQNCYQFKTSPCTTLLDTKNGPHSPNVMEISSNKNG